MKRHISFFIILLIANLLKAESIEFAKFTNLEGFEFTHTEWGKRPSDGSGFLIMPDKIGSSISILKETEGDTDKYYISHNGGKTPVIPIAGDNSITFLESYGGNNYFWTICLEEKNPDGSCLLIMTANLTSGTIGIRTKVFRGKAYESE